MRDLTIKIEEAKRVGVIRLEAFPKECRSLLKKVYRKHRARAPIKKIVALCKEMGLSGYSFHATGGEVSREAELFLMEETFLQSRQLIPQPQSL